MEWNNETALKLINFYRERECLWNPTHSEYKNKLKRLEAWKEISELVESNVDDIKKKMESLLTSFRRERQREENKTWSGADEIHKSTWFGFSSMGFLLDKFSVKKTVNTEVISSQNFEERNIKTEENFNPSTKASQDLPGVVTTNKDEPTPIPSKNRHRKSRFLDPSASKQRNQSRTDKAYGLTAEFNEKRCFLDESCIYGNHIAAKHRKYTQHTKSVIEYLIGEILFKADMGSYEKEFTTTHSQAQNTSHSTYNKDNSRNTHTWRHPLMSHTFISQSPSPSTSSQSSDAEVNQNTTVDPPPAQSID